MMYEGYEGSVRRNEGCKGHMVDEGMGMKCIEAISYENVWR